MFLAHRPSRGLITLFERDTSTIHRKALPNLRRKIGVVFQDFRLLEHLSTFDNVALPLRVKGVPEDTRSINMSANLLTWVGLKDQIEGPAGNPVRWTAAARFHRTCGDQPSESCSWLMSRPAMWMMILRYACSICLRN